MSKINHIISTLSADIVCQSAIPNRSLDPGSVFILDNQTSLKGQTIYIGNSNEVKYALENIPIEPYAIIIACGAKESDVFLPLIDKRNFMFIATSSRLNNVHNVLTNILYEYQTWNDKFQNIQPNAKYIHHVLETIYDISGCSVALFDESFKSIEKAGPDCKEINDLEIKTGELQKRKSTKLFISEILCSNGSLHLVMKKGQGKFDYSTLLDIGSKFLQRYLMLNNPYESKQLEIESVFEDILNEKLKDRDEIREKLESCSHNTKEHFSVGLVELSNKKAIIPYNYVIEQLGKLIPDSSAFIIHNKIVILMYHDTRLQTYPFNRKEMDELLFNLDAWMGLSNTMRDYAKIPMAYDMAEVVLTLPRKLGLERQNRCTIHSEFTIYHVIDKFAKEFVKEYGHKKMLYVANPAIIILTRYDAENNTNLRDVLFYYLVNNKSLIKTAKATYMHRNTIVKKLAKINELIDVDLNDGYVQEALLFSCQLLRYSENMLDDNAAINTIK